MGFKPGLLVSEGESGFTLRSPWAVATGKRAQFIPSKNTLGARWQGALKISTMQRRSSYCSLILRSNFCQSSAPGIKELSLLRN